MTVRLWDSEPEEAGFAEGDHLRSIENVRGSAFADTISGSASDNTIEGLEGNDEVLGGGGDDALRGNSQNDLVNGQAGNDRVYGNIGGDRVYGGSAADNLFGGWGDDILQGGGGNDRLRGDGGQDIFQMTSGGGTDTIEDFETSGTFTDLIDVHQLLDDIAYDGTTPLADGIVALEASGNDVNVNVRSASGFATVAIVETATVSSLNDEGFLVTTEDYWFGT